MLWALGTIIRVTLFILLACGLTACAENTDTNNTNSNSNNTDWSLHGGDYKEQRYSPLTQINTNTVKELGLAWQFDNFVVRGRTHRANEATPLVVDGVIYFTGPWSVVYALDAKTGEPLWQYDPGVEGQWIRKACCDAVNRGVALWRDKIYVGTLDGYLDALDRKSGKRLWRVDTLTDRSRGYTITGAPRIAGDNIVIGNGGAELGVRGYLTAYNLQTGALAWRFYTVPGPGPDEHGEITQARPTWSESTRWEYGGGGTVWDSMAYDPESNLLYIGTGNGSPWPAWVRSPGGGDNLYLSSILAINADNGALQWHYQTTPADSWDYTATQHIVLADIALNNQPRKILMQAPKNGFFYMLDRLSGELISAEPYTKVTWAEKIDLNTGRPVLNGSANYQHQPREIWPSTAGGHNWQPMSYNPDTGLVYIPVLEAPQKFTTLADAQYRDDSVTVAARSQFPPYTTSDGKPQGPDFQSVLKAWNPVSQTTVWKSDPMPWWNGGVLSTAGNLVFQGSLDGLFSAFDAKTGDVLKQINTGLAIKAAPITYTIDGTQYIAVLAGFGGGVKVFPPGSAPLTYENVEKLFVFKLNGGAIELPPQRQPSPSYPVEKDREYDTVLVNKGRQLFFDNCVRCHAPKGRVNGYPDLWNLPPGLYDSLEVIILDGAMAYSGMPDFADLLTKQDVRAIREFLIANHYL